MKKLFCVFFAAALAACVDVPDISGPTASDPAVDPHVSARSADTTAAGSDADPEEGLNCTPTGSICCSGNVCTCCNPEYPSGCQRC